MARLGDICNIQSGGTPSRSNPLFWKGGTIPWVKISDIKGKYLNNVEETITDDGLKNSSAKIFPAGTILYSIFATIGEVCILDIDASTNQALAGIQIIGENIDRDYLYYYLVSLKKEASTIGRGVAQNNINIKILRDFEIPIPPLEEQRRIAAILDKVTSLIALRKQQLAKLDELVKARFVEMFGDLLCEDANHRKVPLESLAKIGSSKRIFENEYVFSGIPFYRTKEIVELSKGDSVSTELYISNERFSEIRRKYGAPQKGDLLISAVGTIGVIWIVDQSQDFYYKDGNLLQVSPGTTLDSVFLKYILEELISFYKSKMSTGTAYNALTISELRKMMIPVVDYSKQKNFASFTKKVIEIKLTIRQNLDILEILKNSLLQKCFKRGSYNA